jgi:membrane protein
VDLAAEEAGMSGDGTKGSVLEKAMVAAVAAVAVVEGVKGVRSKPHGPSQDGRASPPDHRAGRRPPESPEAQSEEGGPKKIIKKVDRFQRTHAWAGFPLGVVKKFGEDQAGNLAALISYYTFFSLFPLLLALVTILGFVLHGNADLQQRILGSALSQFPIIGDQIRNNVHSLSGNGWALLVGLAGAIWAGMGAVSAAQNAMNSVWDVPYKDQPNFIKQRIRSLIMLVVLGGGLVVAAAGSSAASWFDGIGVAGKIAAPVVAALVNIGIFMLAFRVLTERDLGWSDVFPGAVVAGIAVAAFQIGGGFLVNRSLRGATQTYGTFAVVIGLLSWIYLQAQVILYAAEINVVRSRRLWPRSLDQSDLTAADRRALKQHAEVEERVQAEDVEASVPAAVSGPTAEGRSRPTR